jgi:Sulfotransferase domain
MLLDRIFNPNISVGTRLVQLTNAAMLPLVAKPLRITHLVEFPKCGGSWVRNMIRTYIGSPPHLGDRLIFRDAVISAHRRYRRSFAYPVVVVRDPRDLYVSFYHHENNLENREEALATHRYFTHDPDRDVREDFALYLEAKLLKPTHPWFFYSQFIDSWQHRTGSCMLRYEDFLSNPEQQLIRAIRFLDRPVDLEKIREAVEINSFTNQTKLRYGEERTSGVADNTRFVRKGVAGDWKNHFNERSCRLLEKLEGPTLRRLGYESSPDWIDDFLENAGTTGPS